MLRSYSILLRYRIVVISNPRPGYPDVIYTLHKSISKKRSTCHKYYRTTFTFHCLSRRCSRRPPSVLSACLSIHLKPFDRSLPGLSTKDMPRFVNVTSSTTYFRLIVKRSQICSTQHSTHNISIVSATRPYTISQNREITIRRPLR
jgi:hypothetical protein